MVRAWGANGPFSLCPLRLWSETSDAFTPEIFGTLAMRTE